MSGLLGATTAPLCPGHGRCGVDLHDRDDGGGAGCTTDSGNNTNYRNKNKNNDDNTNKNNQCDDDRNNYEHTSDVMTEPGIILEK